LKPSKLRFLAQVVLWSDEGACLDSGETGCGMNCKSTIRFICEYLEGRLTPSVASEVHRHLASCKDCRTIFDAAARTLEIYFDREAEEHPAEHSKVA